MWTNVEFISTDVPSTNRGDRPQTLRERVGGVVSFWILRQCHF